MEKSIKKIFLIFSLILCLFTLTSCKNIDTYDDMKTVKYERILSQSNFSATGTYYVIVYRTGCAVCEAILPEVAKYANAAKKNADADPIYSLNKSDKKNNAGISAESGTKENKGLGATYYEDIKLASSPVLLKIENGKVTKLIDTRTKILAELEVMNSKYE